jgi:Tol biopolymer transport system component
MRGEARHGRGRWIGIVLAALLLAAGLAAIATAKPHKPQKTTTKRASVRSNGSEVNADNDFGAISGNGRFVTFESVGKFTRGDSIASEDVFRRDRKTGKTRRVSLKSNGKQVPGGGADDSVISSSGRYVAFHGEGAFVAGDNNGQDDVYVKNMKTGKVRRASVRSDGSEIAYASLHPAISGNGRFVAFDSEGPFVGADTNGISDVFRHDMKTGKTIRVDIRSDGTQTEYTPGVNFGADSEEPSISGDGNLVAYESIDDTMTADPDYDNQIDTDIFVRNVKKGTTTRVSLEADGSEANATNNQTNRYPAVSGNGRFVAFSADTAGSYVTGDTNNRFDVYVKNLVSGAIGRVSLKTNGDEALDNSGADAPPAISANGQRVAFESYGQLVPSDTSNVYRDVYIRDRKAKKTIRASVTTKRKQVDGYSHQLPVLSADGRWIAFSTQGEFTGGDSGVDFDVFERGPIR